MVLGEKFAAWCIRLKVKIIKLNKVFKSRTAIEMKLRRRK